MTNTSSSEKKETRGRKPLYNEHMKEKILQAARIGCSNYEIALHCGVSAKSIYLWIKGDEELGNKIDLLRETPTLKARKTLVKSLNQPQFALEYLKRKKRDEFGDKVTMKVEAPTPLLSALLSDETLPHLNDRAPKELHEGEDGIYSE